MAGVDAPTLLTGRVVTPGGVVDDGAVLLEGDRIAWVGPRSEVRAPEASTPRDWGAGRTLLPGLVDLHCHGGAGGEFGPDADSARTAAAHHLRHGTTSLVASLVSAPGPDLVAGAAACAPLVAEGVLAGVHLEGPFLSVARCGAQDPAALIDPDPALVDAVVAAGAGGVVQMTFAPERQGADALMAQLAAARAVPAVGHTDADAADTRAALDRILTLGARGGRPLVTHVFNGMPPLHHRSPGPVAAALASAGRSEAVLEVIGDGVHLAAETVRMLFETVGPDSLALITDSMAASGMPEGRYSLGGRDVVVEGRTARLASGGSIAGGVATLLDVVRWCVSDVGVPLADAVVAASRTPAAVMGWAEVGALEAGRRADLLVVDDALEPVRVLRAGTWLP
ncbi:MAG TPA: amidohydrolase family protein [Lapillicoccus sp.]|nr:amidohydrolase family protein [Lapillicoccus sp.]